MFLEEKGVRSPHISLLFAIILRIMGHFCNKEIPKSGFQMLYATIRWRRCLTARVKDVLDNHQVTVYSSWLQTSSPWSVCPLNPTAQFQPTTALTQTETQRLHALGGLDACGLKQLCAVKTVVNNSLLDPRCYHRLCRATSCSYGDGQRLLFRDARCQSGGKDTQTGLKQLQTRNMINKSGLVVSHAETRFSPPGNVKMDVEKLKEKE